MRISKSQIRKIIRESLRLSEGYSVPRFSNSASMEDWVDELVDSDPEAEVDDDVMDPETGEVVIPAGESASEQIWFQDRDDYDPYADSEGVAKMAPDEDEVEDEIDREAELEKRIANDDRIQDMVTQKAVEAGEDWGADTLYQAQSDSSMWKKSSGGYNQYESPEDYVRGFGQDAAADMAESFLTYSMEAEVEDWFRSLPTKDPDYWSDDANRPTQQTMKDVVADYFYDGVMKALKKKAA